jgi:hypothetical protein
MRFYISEKQDEKNTPDMVYWAFDWDDNIMIMPTKIVVLDSNGKELGMSTEDWAEYKDMVGNEDFEYKGRTIVGLANNPFRYFSTEHDKMFTIDAMLGKPGPAWEDFRDAINGGSIFSIITARGHSPLKIRSTIEKMIDGNFRGISKQELVKNLRKYRNIAGEEDMPDDELIDAYMDMNRYYPVTFEKGTAQSPAKLKNEKLREFESYVKYISNQLHKPYNIKNLISNKFNPVIYFSDDDESNLEYSYDRNKNRPDSIINYVTTKGGVKKPYGNK